MALRPMALQIVAGILHGRTSAEIAKSLHERQAMETIEINEAG
jgi:hypothetical protein